MKFVNPVLIVKDKRRAFDFYRDVIGLRLVADFGDYVTLSCGVTLRSEDSWRKMNGFSADSIVYGNASELFFEEEASCVPESKRATRLASFPRPSTNGDNAMCACSTPTGTS